MIDKLAECVEGDLNRGMVCLCPEILGAGKAFARQQRGAHWQVFPGWLVQALWRRRLSASLQGLRTDPLAKIHDQLRLMAEADEAFAGDNGAQQRLFRSYLNTYIYQYFRHDFIRDCKKFGDIANHFQESLDAEESAHEVIDFPDFGLDLAPDFGSRIITPRPWSGYPHSEEAALRWKKCQAILDERPILSRCIFYLRIYGILATLPAAVVEEIMTINRKRRGGPLALFTGLDLTDTTPENVEKCRFTIEYHLEPLDVSDTKGRIHWEQIAVLLDQSYANVTTNWGRTKKYLEERLSEDV